MDLLATLILTVLLLPAAHERPAKDISTSEQLNFNCTVVALPPGFEPTNLQIVYVQNATSEIVAASAFSGDETVMSDDFERQQPLASVKGNMTSGWLFLSIPDLLHSMSKYMFKCVAHGGFDYESVLFNRSVTISKSHSGKILLSQPGFDVEIKDWQEQNKADPTDEKCGSCHWGVFVGFALLGAFVVTLIQCIYCYCKQLTVCGIDINKCIERCTKSGDRQIHKETPDREDPVESNGSDPGASELTEKSDDFPDWPGNGPDTEDLSELESARVAAQSVMLKSKFRTVYPRSY